METPLQETTADEPRFAYGRPDERPADSEDALWRVLGTLYQRRRFIVRATLLTAALSIVIALLLPRWYAAEARVLQPEGGGLSGLLGMVNRATGGLGSLLGGGGGYERYLAILTSRSMMEDVIDRFNLLEVYEVKSRKGPMAARFKTIDKLEKNLDFKVSLDYDYLAIVAYDRDPERSAEMANYLVDRLNEENARLTSESARRTREVIERRLNRATADLDSVRSELQVFQETHGLVELEAQAEAMMQSAASLRAEVARLDVQYQTLVQQYGPDNPQVRAARQARAAAQQQINQVLGGRDALLPVAIRDLPALTTRYAQLMQQQMIQREILETIYPIYEQALFQEQSEAEAVQVIDRAIPPVQPARPSRRLVVIGATLTGLLLACLFVLGQSWVRRNAGPISARLRRASLSA